MLVFLVFALVVVNVVAAASAVMLRFQNKELNVRLADQTHWLVALDNDFDCLSLKLAHIRAHQEDSGPSEEEIRRCEDELVDLLGRLMNDAPAVMV